MKLYLLSCKNIQTHAERILPLLPEQRRLAYDRSRSGLTLGTGLLLSSLLGIHRDADLSMGAYGKPFLTCGTPEFSLSHSGEHVLLGVSDQPIGVDMERSGRQVPEAVRRRICLPGEREFSLPLGEIDTTRDYRWQEKYHRFFTVEQEGYLISVLSAEKDLPEIQLLTPEDLL